MAIQTVTVPLKLEWDDSVVLVFSFDGPAGQVFCGFVHQVLAVQFVSGSQAQVTPALQIVQQQGIQVSLDPQTWVETAKTGARGGNATVVFDDALSTVYTTQTNQSFQLQALFSLTA
jgi:hypothetical protein